MGNQTRIHDVKLISIGNSKGIRIQKAIIQIVIPVSTSSSQTQRGPTVVVLPSVTAGLKSDSAAIGHQITTLDRAKLICFPATATTVSGGSVSPYLAT